VHFRDDIARLIGVMTRGMRSAQARRGLAGGLAPVACEAIPHRGIAFEPMHEPRDPLAREPFDGGSQVIDSNRHLNSFSVRGGKT
jgi:hypothetical protein